MEKDSVMTGLQHPFPSVRKGALGSYGGNQNWSPKGLIQKSGCGVISCTDVLLYLNRHRPGCKTEFFGTDTGDDPVPLGRYNGWVERFSQRFLPLAPHFGSPGLVAALALNRYFLVYRIPLRACWGVSGKTIWAHMEAMLLDDLPVILSIGPNFPLPLGQHKLTLYHPQALTPACETTAHFVTVTGMDGHWLRISSWGREYLIARREWQTYTQRHSSFLVSNMVFLHPR